MVRSVFNSHLLTTSLGKKTLVLFVWVHHWMYHDFVHRHGCQRVLLERTQNLTISARNLRGSQQSEDVGHDRL